MIETRKCVTQDGRLLVTRLLFRNMLLIAHIVFTEDGIIGNCHVLLLIARLA